MIVILLLNNSNFEGPKYGGSDDVSESGGFPLRENFYSFTARLCVDFYVRNGYPKNGTRGSL
jgi:hypothetical protein